MAQERIKARQALLDAIGHEIKSPLQTLSTEIPWDTALGHQVQRMVRAVDALFEATSIEAAFKNGKIICKTADLASFLSRLAENLAEKDWQIKYVGPPFGVSAVFDPISFETVLDHLLNNANRHKFPGSKITIALEKTDVAVKVDVTNSGPQVPPDQLETIFNLGFSTTLDPENRGLGLFAVRSYILGMRGTIHAENRPGGVSFVILFPRKSHI